jgi:hypothetical protein
MGPRFAFFEPERWRHQFGGTRETGEAWLSGRASSFARPADLPSPTPRRPGEKKSLDGCQGIAAGEVEQVLTSSITSKLLTQSASDLTSVLVRRL